MYRIPQEQEGEWKSIILEDAWITSSLVRWPSEDLYRKCPNQVFALYQIPHPTAYNPLLFVVLYHLYLLSYVFSSDPVMTKTFIECILLSI